MLVIARIKGDGEKPGAEFGLVLDHIPARDDYVEIGHELAHAGLYFVTGIVHRARGGGADGSDVIVYLGRAAGFRE